MWNVIAAFERKFRVDSISPSLSAAVFIWSFFDGSHGLSRIRRDYYLLYYLFSYYLPLSVGDVCDGRLINTYFRTNVFLHMKHKNKIGQNNNKKVTHTHVSHTLLLLLETRSILLSDRP